MSKHQPALLGGLFIGVLSALPGVQAGNCCCCLWVVCGGLLTTYLLQQQTDLPVQTSDAVVAGLIAGLVGGLVAGVLDLMLAPFIAPFQQRMVAWFFERLQNMPNLPAESRAQIDEALKMPVDVPMVLRFVRTLTFVPFSAVFAMLGSLLGLAFFRKKTPPAPPVQG